MIRAAARLVPVMALAAAVAAGDAGALKSPGVIRIEGLEVKRTLVDLGRKGRSAGDLDYRRLSLFNRRITSKAIGHAEVVCTYTGNRSSDCRGTYFLPKGSIVTQGVIGSRLFYTQAVAGGTGLYDNVRGTLTATWLGAKPAPRHLLLFRLVV